MRPARPKSETSDNWFSFDGASVVKIHPKQGLFKCFQKVRGLHTREHLIVYTNKGSYNCWYDPKSDTFKLQRLK